MATITRLSGRALVDLLPDLAAHPGPRYAVLAQAIVSLLLDGRIAPGTRLPSERELAAALGLSRATVTSAYDQLRREAVLTSQTGSGSVLALPSRDVGLGAPASRWRTAAQPAPVRTAAARSTTDVLDLSCAVFAAPPELEAAMITAGERIGQFLGGSGYEPWGLLELREAVAHRFCTRGTFSTSRS